jgi:hypothetical protein
MFDDFESDLVFDVFCQLTVPGFEYTSKGFASNKKDAESAAAKDFCGYLIGAGIVPAESLPDNVFAEEMNATVPPLPGGSTPSPHPPPRVHQQPIIQQPSQFGGPQQSNFGGPSSSMNGIML